MFKKNWNIGSTCEACVKKISTRLASVDVEWCENGETKGKEVSMHMILSLNTQYRAPEDEVLWFLRVRKYFLQKPTVFF